MEKNRKKTDKCQFSMYVCRPEKWNVSFFLFFFPTEVIYRLFQWSLRKKTETCQFLWSMYVCKAKTDICQFFSVFFSIHLPLNYIIVLEVWWTERHKSHGHEDEGRLKRKLGLNPPPWSYPVICARLETRRTWFHFKRFSWCFFASMMTLSASGPPRFTSGPHF